MIGDSRIALIAARTKGPKATTLPSEKAAIVSGSDTAGDPAPAGGTVAGVLDALKSVVPTVIAGVYTASVVVIRGGSQTDAAAERAELQATLAKTGASEDAIKKALERLPEESANLVGLRWLLVGVAIAAVVAVTVQAAKDAQKRKKKKRFPAAELAVAVVAFIGWALASPGTPLAAYHSTSTLLVLSAVIAACAGFFVAGFGKLVLTKPAAK